MDARAPARQRTPKDVLADLLLEFLQALVHEFL